jgi:diguanylate cyclase (GGDEF)-like protein
MTSGPHAISLRGAWKLGGALLLVVAGSTIAASPLVEDSTGAGDFLIAGLTALAGLICLWLPWERVDERWLAAVPLLAVVAIAFAAASVDYALDSLFLAVALYAALVFPPRRITLFVALIIGALVLPFAYSDQSAQQTATWLLVVGPVAVFTAVVTGLLTARLHSSRETYRQLSAVDALTGVGNYRALMERLDHETRRHARRRREFAVLILDLDNFKEVNDTQGHLVGDAVLTTVGSMIDVQVRAEDGIFRQGGDEFSVVAPETGPRQARLLASRIERAVNGLTSGSVRISASIGHAVYPHHGSEPGELLEAADRDLRSQKREHAGSSA